MKVSDFDFALPPELVAQSAVTDRESAKLLRLDRAGGALRHAHVSDLPGLLDDGDLLVVNNTKVFPARLLGRREPSGGAVECLLVRRISGGIASDQEHSAEEVWEALVHPGQKLKEGARLRFEGAGSVLHGEVRERMLPGRRLVRLWTDGGASIESVVDRIGHVPLPPYIRRDDEPADRDRYQTVFAAARGSIAAPTAGLHFTGALLSGLRARGVGLAQITLHVGYGTFQPVRVENVEDQHVEAERYEIEASAADAINRAAGEGRRVIAVGTTTTRTLESVARAHGGRIVAGAGSTDLFIFPGFEFRVVRGLITNFHLPKSSLLMLVSAFAGREAVLAAYRAAIERAYRFYSYGDAMLIV